MSNEKELAQIEAVRNVLAQLDGLEPDEQKRVLLWVAEMRGFEFVGSNQRNHGDHDGETLDIRNEEGDAATTMRNAEFADFSDLCTAADPKTEVERALVAGYWLQVSEGRENFGSQDCNNLLKDFGTPIGNVTRAFDRLKSHRPALAQQTQKSGRTKQARKLYKITVNGQRRVKEMIDGSQET